MSVPKSSPDEAVVPPNADPPRGGLDTVPTPADGMETVPSVPVPQAVIETIPSLPEPQPALGTIAVLPEAGAAPYGTVAVAPEPPPRAQSVPSASPVDPDRSDQFTPGTLIGNRYRIVSLIGKGGMGAVYRADDLKLGQTVALKFLAARAHADGLVSEVRVGRQISHPNVCRLHDLAEVDGHVFITMEFVDGEDLASLLRRVGRLSAEKAAAVARDICAGVAAIHEMGVVHRDLKPANVMIDGRGRARVADFGLAQFGEEPETRAGTPAYMAPEQLSGGPASFKSDIYALGLVLYEVFTGKRAFDASSIGDLVVKQQRSDFSRPSLVTREVPADVERVITQCLDPRPKSRPQSVAEILRALPGGEDPLGAIVAAGETPTPAMVAAATDRGDLSQRAAWSWLGAVLVLLSLQALFAHRTTLYGRLTIKPPDVLRERAREILAATGETLPVADWSQNFATDRDSLDATKGDAGVGATTPLIFHYRQSPRMMTPKNFDRRVVRNDPPLVDSGMAEVLVDSTGFLQQLTIVPPQRDTSPVRGEVDWSKFFAYTAVRPPLTPVEPEWAALVDSDRKQAWMDSDGTRVEVSSYRGRPVSFMVVPPWRSPTHLTAREKPGGGLAAIATVIMNAVFFGAALLLARRNMRRGRVDRRNAWRVAVVLFVASFVSGLLIAHHVPDLSSEMQTALATVAFSLLAAAQGWLGYVAIEPLVRRRWPRVLIGVTRLLEGRFRDPMVGRDILVGTAGGAALVWIRHLTSLLPDAAPFQSANQVLTGIEGFGWFLGVSVVAAAIAPLIAATLLVAAEWLTRNLRAAIVVVVTLLALVMFVDAAGPLWARALFGLICGAGAILLVFRFGLLSYGAAAFAYAFLRRMPVTLDPTAWYFGRSTLALAILLAVALYGFVIALGGKRFLPDVVDRPAA